MQQTKKIPVFILAGGFGTRLSEETGLKPKPMIEIGNIPMLVHIMRYYYRFGFDDFVICAGYRSWEIKDYFMNYRYRQNHLCIDLRAPGSGVSMYEEGSLGHEKWRVRVVDSGIETLTGSRLAVAFDHVAAVEKFEEFAVTYGDGLTDANLASELEYHRAHGKIGTVLGVPPLSRFGLLEHDDSGDVLHFREKPSSHSDLINGGFFFFRREFRKYLDLSGQCLLEQDPLKKLVEDHQLKAFAHKGFWQCMDTLRDKNHLQSLWDDKTAPWIPLQERA